MKMKKIISACLAVACVASLLGGCGGQKQASSEKVTLTLWNRPAEGDLEWKIEQNNRLEESLKEKFPNINFDFKTAPAGGTDYRQEYDKALMAGTAPAIYDMFSYTDIPARLENGTVADITKYVDNWDLMKEGKILNVFDEAISKDNKWYAIPKYAYTQATMVNLKTIEFADFGAKITDVNVPRIGYSLLGMDWCAWPFTAWVWSAGGEMVEKNSDGTYRIAFADDEAVDTAVFLNEMIWKYKMTQKDVLADLGTVYKNILNGTAVKDSSIKRPALAGGEVITFNPKLTETELDAAMEVAKWMYFSDERMQTICDEIKEFEVTDVNIPGRVDWYEKKLEANTQITDKQKDEFIKLSENAKPEPFCAHWSEVKSELVAPLQKIYLTEGLTRDEIKQILSECADKLYSQYPDTFKK